MAYTMRLYGTRESPKIGKCELCGAHNQKLRIFVMPDYIGWTCERCISQLGDCLRKIVCEQTEPSE